MTDDTPHTAPTAYGADGGVRLDISAADALTFLDVAAVLTNGGLERYLPEAFRVTVRQLSEAAWQAQHVEECGEEETDSGYGWACVLPKGHDESHQAEVTW